MLLAQITPLWVTMFFGLFFGVSLGTIAAVGLVTLLTNPFFRHSLEKHIDDTTKRRDTE